SREAAPPERHSRHEAAGTDLRRRNLYGRLRILQRAALPEEFSRKPAGPVLAETSAGRGELMSESDPLQSAVGWRRFPRHPAARLPSLRASILAGRVT